MERVFFPFDAELKAELDQIKLAIQGEQNGMATRQMGQMTYKKNYGVSYVVLRELAAQYKPSKKLAGCLWKIGYRETMLLALLLFPVNEIDRQEASALVKEMTEMELVEFASRGLLASLPFAWDLVEDCLQSNAGYAKETAYLLAARLLEKASGLPPRAAELLERVKHDLAENKASVARAVSNFLKQLGLFASQTEKVMRLIDQFSEKEDMHLRWVAEEVRTFVEYTDEKK